MLPENKMPEAEVTLRLAMSLIEGGHTHQDVSTAIDGAQVKTGSAIHFPILEFLTSHGWFGSSNNGRWQDTYTHVGFTQAINIHSSPGQSDLVAHLNNHRVLKVESKKGPLSKSKSSQEYPLMREAIGQLMTMTDINESDVLAIAVPHSEKFASLADKWRQQPLMKKASINIITIDRSNKIRGLKEFGI